MGDLLDVVYALVHPIDTSVHPAYAAGWRWAVMVGGVPVNDLDHCANAGSCETRTEAAVEAEGHAATAVVAMRMLGVNCDYGRLIELDHDPIPASADDRPLIELR